MIIEMKKNTKNKINIAANEIKILWNNGILGLNFKKIIIPKITAK